MIYNLKFPYEYDYHFHLDKNDDDTKNGSIFYMEGPGRAVCMAKQPRFGDDEEWEAFSELVIDAVETYKKTGVKPSELLERLQAQNSR